MRCLFVLLLAISFFFFFFFFFFLLGREAHRSANSVNSLKKVRVSPYGDTLTLFGDSFCRTV